MAVELWQNGLFVHRLIRVLRAIRFQNSLVRKKEM